MSKKLKDGYVQQDHILFNEKAHTYTNTFTGELYPSVTTVISKFKPKVISEDLLTKKVKKELSLKYKGLPPPPKSILEAEFNLRKAELADKWDKLKEAAGVFGTGVHAILEDYYTGEPVDEKSPYILVLNNFIKKFDKIKYKQILNEELLYSDKYKIAGLADRILIHEDDEFSIEDYKTNKKFDLQGFQSYDGVKMLYAPFDFLEDCHLNVYTIQLGIYAYLFSERTGRKLKSLNIYWYNRAAKFSPDTPNVKEMLDCYDNIDGEWVKIECKYLVNEIKYLLENHFKIKSPTV